VRSTDSVVCPAQSALSSQSGAANGAIVLHPGWTSSPGPVLSVAPTAAREPVLHPGQARPGVALSSICANDDFRTRSIAVAGGGVNPIRVGSQPNGAGKLAWRAASPRAGEMPMAAVRGHRGAGLYEAWQERMGLARPHWL